jgi:nucleotide-binding universal stress UspA family protein
MTVLTPVRTDKVEKIVRTNSATTFHTVLTATDFTPASERAFSFALGLAHRYGAMLDIVHALPLDEVGIRSMVPVPREMDTRLLEAEKHMKRAAKDAKTAGVANEVIMEKGHVSDVIADVAWRYNADLLVVGTHGRSGFKKLALGSVAEAVLRMAGCPVLTVSEHVPLPPSGVPEFHTILFATDFGPASMKAWPYALALAEEFGARLVMLHIVTPASFVDSIPGAFEPAMYAAEDLVEKREAACVEGLAHLKKLIPPDANLAHEPKVLASPEFAPEGILNAAKVNQADLIVMGANPSKFARAAAHDPWTVCHTILAEAKCPVLTVAGTEAKKN